MSETIRTLVESLLMIGAISAGFVWYALVAARREDRNDQLLSRSGIDQKLGGANTFAKKRMAREPDPDAHLGRCGTE